MGALIAFELARSLRRRGLPSPVHLVVSGHRTPQLADPHPPSHRLPDPEFLTQLRLFGGTPESVLRNPELVELLLPLLRADFTVCETYNYTDEEPLSCPIAAFGGDKDPRVRGEELSGWREQTTRSFSLEIFPGSHFFINEVRILVLRVLARDLRQVLRRIAANP
jgi:medium-chain acyl-[acyl-carrier-protein] hydrolase